MAEPTAPTPEEEEKLRQLAAKQYPGRGLEDLSEQELQSVFSNYEALIGQAAYAIAFVTILLASRRQSGKELAATA